MSRRYRLDELKGFELWLLRTAMLLMILVSGLFNLVTLTSGEIKMKGQPAPIRRTSEPVKYWFFSSVTLFLVILLGAGLAYTFTAVGKPVKRQVR
jgi:hypothetical protein